MTAINRIIGRRFYSSHEPSIGLLYSQTVKNLDGTLARHRPDLFTLPSQVDDLLAIGVITPHMASVYKEDIEKALVAKSSHICLIKYFKKRRRNGRECFGLVEYP